MFVASALGTLLPLVGLLPHAAASCASGSCGATAAGPTGDFSSAMNSSSEQDDCDVGCCMKPKKRPTNTQPCQFINLNPANCRPPVSPCEELRNLCSLLRVATICEPDQRLYYEFANIGAFFSGIGIDGARGLFASRHQKALMMTIENAAGFSEFDSLVPYYYNCDVNIGLAAQNPVFDLHFSNWLIARFRYILYCIFARCNDPRALRFDLVNYRFIFRANREPVNLINIPPQDDTLACTSLVANGIINTLLANTRIYGFVQFFLRALIRELGTIACGNTCVEIYTTAQNYRDLLIACLQRSLEITNGNVFRRMDYLKTNAYYTFVSTPMVETPPPTTPPAPPAVPSYSFFYLQIPNTSIPIMKLAMYS